MVELLFVYLFVVMVSCVLYCLLFFNCKKNVYFDEKEYYNKILYVFLIDLFCLSFLNIQVVYQVYFILDFINMIFILNFWLKKDIDI